MPAGPRRTPPREATTNPRPKRVRRAADENDGERRLTLAVVVGAHGIGGEVRLKLFTDDLAAYPVVAAGDRTLTLRSVRAGGNGAIARFAELTDRDAAEGLRGLSLTIARSALPALGDDEYYHADLIGLDAVSTEGAPLGRVAAVENFGAGDVLEIERADGRTFMVPMTAEAVPDWRGRVVIDPAFVT